MLTKIYKYPLELTDFQTLVLPQDSEILSAQVQNDCICVWVGISNRYHIAKVEFAIVGTGNPFPQGNWKFLDTVQQDGFVWHVFYKKGA